MPSASGIELMEQEYRKKIDQLDDEINDNIENVSGGFLFYKYYLVINPRKFYALF